MAEVPLYDTFAEGYDLMTDWPARLASEAAFFQGLFAAHGVRSRFWTSPAAPASTPWPLPAGATT